MIKGILVLIGVVIVITFGYFVSNRNDKNTKVILIIIGVIGLLAFAYFTRIDGYLGRIEKFSSYETLPTPIKFVDNYTEVLTKV